MTHLRHHQRCSLFRLLLFRRFEDKPQVNVKRSFSIYREGWPLTTNYHISIGASCNWYHYDWFTSSLSSALKQHEMLYSVKLPLIYFMGIAKWLNSEFVPNFLQRGSSPSLTSSTFWMGWMCRWFKKSTWIEKWTRLSGIFCLSPYLSYPGGLPWNQG